MNGDLAATFAGALLRVAGETVAGGPYSINQGTLAASGNYSVGTFNAGALSIIPNTSGPSVGSASASTTVNIEVLELTEPESPETTKVLNGFICRRKNDPSSCEAM